VLFNNGWKSKAGFMATIAVAPATTKVAHKVQREELISKSSSARFPSPVEGMSQRSLGVASLLLQFRQASPGTEIRAASQDTIPAGWAGQEGADVEGSLLCSNCFLGTKKDPVRVGMLLPSLSVYC